MENESDRGDGQQRKSENGVKKDSHGRFRCGKVFPEFKRRYRQFYAYAPF